MPDAGFEQFYRDTATLAWPSADAIARRGRRRRIHQRVAAGVGAAAVAVSIVLAGAAVRGGGPGPAPVPPASPPASPTPSVTGSGAAAPAVSPSGQSGTSPSGTSPSATLTQVPPAAMLRAADAGPGTWTVADEANGDYSVFFTFRLCAATNGMSHVEHLHQRERTISRDEMSDVQRVELFAPGRAADYMEGVRARVRACGTFTSQFDGRRITVRIVHDGFAAADESFLVEVSSDGTVGWHAFVRRGVLVTEVVAWPGTLAETLRLGRAAANRLAEAGG
jgi:hypothetical protein